MANPIWLPMRPLVQPISGHARRCIDELNELCMAPAHMRRHTNPWSGAPWPTPGIPPIRTTVAPLCVRGYRQTTQAAGIGTVTVSFPFSICPGSATFAVVCKGEGASRIVSPSGWLDIGGAPVPSEIWYSPPGDGLTTATFTDPDGGAVLVYMYEFGEVNSITWDPLEGGNFVGGGLTGTTTNTNAAPSFHAPGPNAVIIAGWSAVTFGGSVSSVGADPAYSQPLRSSLALVNGLGEYQTPPVLVGGSASVTSVVSGTTYDLFGIMQPFYLN